MMAGWLERRQLRAMMTPLLEGELDSSTMESVRARIEADPVLAGELRRLELAVGSLHRFAPRAVPAEVREDLDLSLMIEAKPLRARYGELLDGTAKPREAAALRAQIAADAELDSEFSLLSAGLEIWRAEAPAPVPTQVRARIDRAIDFEQTRHIVPVPSRHPILRQRFAMAGAAAVMLFGLIVARVGDRPGTPMTPPVPSVAMSQAASEPPEAPAAVAPASTPAAATAVKVAQAAPVAAKPTPAVRRSSSPAVTRVASRSRVSEARSVATRVAVAPPKADSGASNAKDGQRGSATSAISHVVAATPVTMLGADSGSSIQGSMPEPSAINSVDAGSSPLAINFASETREPGF